MNILFFSNYSELYGANRSMLTIIEYLKNRGNNVKLILPTQGSICKELERKGIAYIIVKMFTQLYYYKFQLKYLAVPILDFFTMLKLSKLTRIAREFQPDLIYSNTSAEMVGIKIAKRIGTKHISHIREFMNLDHGAKYLLGNKAKRDYINQSDGVIYVSNSVAESVNMGQPLRKWQQVIYNGIKTEGEYRNIPFTKELNLGIVGIFDPAKGQDIAIQTMPKILKIYPKAKLHLWGDKAGKYKQRLIRLVEKLSLQNHVIFHGYETDANKIYRDMHVLLMCSRCEGFGRVTIEAMQRGIPVLGYNSGGTSELIKNGENGYLFNNENECIDGLKNMLQSPDVFNQFRKKAFEDSRLNFSVEKYCANVEDFINKIVSM